MEMLSVLAILCSSNTVFPQRVAQTLLGLPDKLPNTLETGYIGVGEDEEVQLFYYFFESEGNPENDPFIFWITGGLGCSSLSVILMEIGTFVVDFPNCPGDPTTLKLNEYAWTKSAKTNCHGNYKNTDPNNTLCVNDLEKINQEDNAFLSHSWANDKAVQKALNVREVSPNSI
ncbi:UNVERIFIED_CONTAM: Serine carboxypeptidase-like 13 [Sesamum calycinum]|uniref:Serine carboxypeptidase-like 13 n=1 Tax=Sesamum calycinum TaxID=2727403 RepID=A0AAW2JBV0_9LAMI